MNIQLFSLFCEIKIGQFNRKLHLALRPIARFAAELIRNDFF